MTHHKSCPNHLQTLVWVTLVLSCQTSQISVSQCLWIHFLRVFPKLWKLYCNSSTNGNFQNLLFYCAFKRCMLCLNGYWNKPGFKYRVWQIIYIRIIRGEWIVLHLAQHIIGHFGDESFQAITCTVLLVCIHWDEFLGQECGFSDVSIICKHLWNLQNGALEICRGCISVKVNWWHYWIETHVDHVDLCSGLCSPGQIDLRASLLRMRVTWSPVSVN